MRISTGIVLAAFGVSGLRAQTSQSPQRPKPTVAFGAFVDAYYAYDFGRPSNIDRFYSTQPARHNEFNVNLAFVEAKLTHDRIRGRVALQAGTSVQSNYLAEPSIGTISGDDVSRFIQEGYVGLRLGEGLWVDGGIFFSHIGQESWISRDNPTYTRSLVADYTPYYSTGVMLTWQASPRLLIRGHVLNGWQNISETNGDKAVGVRIEWAPSSSLLLGYTNFIGNEAPDDQPTRTRVFNQWFAKATLGQTTWWLTVDYGTQDTPTVDGASWFGGAFIGSLRVSPRVALSARVERYSDPDQVIITTGEDYGFQSWGGSLGVDLTVAGQALWRTEVRGYTGEDALWPDPDGGLRTSGGFLVTSLALSF
jgi:hypothetical protein